MAQSEPSAAVGVPLSRATRGAVGDEARRISERLDG
jgi:hypothetical protein